nr:PREDICTED: uncharacterized protein LOC103362935 [Stegastes partitus]
MGPHDHGHLHRENHSREHHLRAPNPEHQTPAHHPGFPLHGSLSGPGETPTDFGTHGHRLLVHHPWDPLPWTPARRLHSSPSTVIIPAPDPITGLNPFSPHNHLAKKMDPTNPSTIKEALKAQGVLLGKHDQLLQGLTDALQSLTHNVQGIASRLDGLANPSSGTPTEPSVSTPSQAASSSSSLPSREPKVPTPEPYAGEPGSCEELKDELASRDMPDTLEALISLAIKIDNRLRERRREKATRARRLTFSPKPAVVPNHSPDRTSPVAAEEPMQLGRTHLTPEERERRMQGSLCLYCGQAGHYAVKCPVKPYRALMKSRIQALQLGTQWTAMSLWGVCDLVSA